MSQANIKIHKTVSECAWQRLHACLRHARPQLLPTVVDAAIWMGCGWHSRAVLSSWPRMPSMLTGTAAPLPWPAVHKARGCLATACKAMFNMDPSDDDATLILEVSQPLALACASPPSCPVVHCAWHVHGVAQCTAAFSHACVSPALPGDT